MLFCPRAGHQRTGIGGKTVNHCRSKSAGDRLDGFLRGEEIRDSFGDADVYGETALPRRDRPARRFSALPRSKREVFFLRAPLYGSDRGRLRRRVFRRYDFVHERLSGSGSLSERLAGQPVQGDVLNVFDRTGTDEVPRENGVGLPKTDGDHDPPPEGYSDAVMAFADQGDVRNRKEDLSALRRAEYPDDRRSGARFFAGSQEIARQVLRRAERLGERLRKRRGDHRSRRSEIDRPFDDLSLRYRRL